MHIGVVDYAGPKEMHRISEFSYLHNKDMAIFKLKNPVAFSDTVQPIRLPTASQIYAPFKDVIAYTAGVGGGLNYLHYITLKIRAMRWNLIETEGYLNYKSQIRPGDSGSPLFIYENGIATQLGVAILTYGDVTTSGNVGLELNWVNDVTSIPVRKFSYQ